MVEQWVSKQCVSGGPLLVLFLPPLSSLKLKYPGLHHFFVIGVSFVSERSFPTNLSRIGLFQPYFNSTHLASGHVSRS